MPILDAHALDFISYNYDQTLRYGVKLGQLLQPRDLVCLSGQLGAGKTATVHRGPLNSIQNKLTSS